MITNEKQAEDLIYKSYLRAIENIKESLDEIVKKPELTRRLLDLVGKPDKGQHFILVAGSKGKGSTSRFISSLLSHYGLKVGLFTSPHLVDFNERIRVNGKAISNEDFIRLSNQIESALDSIEKELPYDQYQGPVGVALTIATMYFKENNTDINIIECGRGGRYDDTNVLDNKWAVITPLMLEHVNNLGASIAKIAEHKLGIIKKGTKNAYISKQSPEAFEFIKVKLNQNKTVAFYGKDFYADNISMTLNGTNFDVTTSNKIYKNLQLPLLGEFQSYNASLAIKVCEDLIDGALDNNIIQKCFSEIKWPGRCEIISNRPTVIVDGAIGKESAEYIRGVLHVLVTSQTEKIISIIGVPKDKDYKGVINVLSEVSDKIIITKPDISHLIFPDDAIDYAKEKLFNSIETPYLEDALNIAKNENFDIILIVGTQTFVGNAKRLFGHSLLDIGK